MDRRAARLIRQLEETTAELKAHLLDRSAPEESEGERWFRTQGGPFLNEIDERGGVVTVDELRELAIKYNYDPRGVGGFAAGKNPSLRSDGDNRVLTTKGRGEAARWRAMYGSESRELVAGR